MKNRGRIAMKVTGVIFLGFGILFIAGGIISAVFMQKYVESADYVMGTISQIVSTYEKDGDRDYSVSVEYEVNGKTYDSTINQYSSSWHEGDKIKLLYDTDNPYDVRSNSMVYIITIIFSVIGGIFALVGILLFVINGASNRRMKLLKQVGKKYDAEVTGCVMNACVRVNYRHPYRVDCKYMDIYSGETYLYRSDNIWEDASRFIGQQVAVYVNPDNPKQYYVDVESLFNTNSSNDSSTIYDYR